MIDIARGAPEALTDITDGTGSAYMAEKHRYKMCPAVDPFAMLIAAMLFYQPVEIFPRKIRQ